MTKPFKNRGYILKILIICLGVMLAAMAAGCAKHTPIAGTCSIEFLGGSTMFCLPKDAELHVQRMTNTAEYEDVQADSVQQNDSCVHYVFSHDDSRRQNIFRIEKAGVVTKAGFFEDSGKLEFALDDGRSVWHRENSYAESDLMISNVGDNYYKVLDVGQKFELKLARNTAISGGVIQPNFELQILQGDSVTIGADGDNNFDVTAAGEGVTFARAKYQAIDILKGGKWLHYNASDPAREAVFAFGVGDNYDVFADVDFGGGALDSEFDTIYFEDDDEKFEALISNGDSVKCNGEEVAYSNGKATLLLQNGVNVLEICRGYKRQYATIYAAKIAIDAAFSNGQLTIGVRGLQNTLPKVSGVYNPSQNHMTGETPSEGSRVQIIDPSGNVRLANYVSQYDYRRNNEVTIAIESEWLQEKALKLEIQFMAQWWGDSLGAHRAFERCDKPNLNAELHSRNIGVFKALIIDTLSLKQVAK